MSEGSIIPSCSRGPGSGLPTARWGCACPRRTARPAPTSGGASDLLVHRPADPEGRFHVDTLNLYAAKARAAFVKAARIELGEAEDVLKHDLGRVLLALEARQEAEISAALAQDEKITKITVTVY